MKKMAISILLGMMVVTGCSNADDDGTDEALNQGNTNPPVTSEEHANEPTDEASGEAESDEKEHSFTVDQLNLDDLKSGVLPGLEFQIGSTFSDIKEQWGEPGEEDHLRGGKYLKYAHEGYDVYLFDPDQSPKVLHIQLNLQQSVSLDDIRSQLGEPDVDALDEMLTGVWNLTYTLGDYTLFVNGKTDDQHGEVNYLFLKSE